jgi:hypothetical protein
MALELVKFVAKESSLFYAWGYVCFETWDFCLANLRNLARKCNS